MRRQFLKSLITSAALPAFPGLLHAQSTSPVRPDTLDLHHIGPLVDVPLASANSEAVKGAEIYFDAINAKGGVNGRKINLVKIHDKQEAKESARLLQELIDSKRALAIFMPRTTPSSYAMMPLAEAGKVLFFGVQNGGSQITDPIKRYVMTLRASYQDEAIAIIRQLYSTGTRRFGVLVDDGPYGKDVILGVNRVFKELKIEPLAVVSINANKPEAAEPVTQMLPKRPDAIILIAGTKGTSDFVRMYREQGADSQFVTLSNNGSDAFVKMLGEHKRGLIVTQAVPSPFKGKRAIAREYQAIAKAAKAPMGFNSFYGFLCAKVMVEGLRRAGRDVNTERLVQALESLGRYDLGNYEITLSPTVRKGSNFVEASIITADGKFLN